MSAPAAVVMFYFQSAKCEKWTGGMIDRVIRLSQLAYASLGPESFYLTEVREEGLMSRLRLIGFVLVACLVTQLSFAADRDKILGTWKLVSYEVEVQATGEKVPVMGQNPTGYAAFLPDGRIFFVLTGEARKPAKTDQERAELLDTLVAYSGTYSVEGDTWTTSVDVAWNPEWVGTKQVRSFKLDGDRLEVLTPWRVMPNWADKGMTRSIVTFERSE